MCLLAICMKDRLLLTSQDISPSLLSSCYITEIILFTQFGVLPERLIERAILNFIPNLNLNNWWPFRGLLAYQICITKMPAVLSLC